MYDAIVLDLDGVIFKGIEVITGVEEAFQILITKGVQFSFVSNNVSRSKAEVLRKLENLLPEHSIDIFDPIDVLERFYLYKRRDSAQAFMVIGTHNLKERLAGLGITVAPEDSTFNISSVLVSSAVGFGYKQLTYAAKAVRNGAKLYASGCEPVFLWQGELNPGSGALVAAIEVASNSRAIVLGKPSVRIFRIASENFIKPSRIVVIGDDIVTDIHGAKNAGLDSVLVLSGITSMKQLKNSKVKPNYVANDLLSFLTSMIK